MRKMRIVALMALIAILATPFAGVRAQDKNLVQVATEAGNFKTLLAAVQAAGLESALTGTDKLTVFAPTDEAFAKLPQAALDFLLKPENKELLASIITYHVAAGEVLAADVLKMEEIKSLQGDMIDVRMFGEVAKVNSAKITATDVKASNGVIHVIDAVILPTIALPEVDVLAITGNILTAGSSTVFPLTRRIGDDFRAAGFIDNVEVANVGTGEGFVRFCKNAETDIANASRAIKDSEVADCQANNREPLAMQVGIDALAVVVSTENTWAQNLTLAQLADIFSGKVKTWNEVDASYPNEPITLFSPGTDSGTFDYFVEIVLEKNKEAILNAPGIQLSENDNVLLQGVAASRGAIGYFGFAYYLPNRDKIRSVSLEGVEANELNAELGTYPLSRPLFIYTTAQILAEKPQVAAFVNYYLTNVNNVLGAESGKVAYFPAPRDSLNFDRLEWLIAASMAMAK
jgi:phosphate transport system substrate-binding protein